MLIVFDSLMTKYDSPMCLISIWIKGSHVHKARIIQCRFEMSVSLTLAFELEVRTKTDVRKNYDKDSLI